MKAMVLAAGLGTRLLPFTLKRPKPLFPVVGRPLLLRITEQLRQAGSDSILVNAHHLREQIVAALADSLDVVVQEEAEELGTGGGLRLARDQFGDQPVLVVNGDIWHDIDVAEVFQRHCESGADVTMVLHDCPRFNNVQVAGGLRVVGFGHEPGDLPASLLAFTGIQVINPAVLELIPAGCFFNIIDCYRLLLEQGGTIKGLVVRDHFWTDMGTPADYLALHQTLLTAKNKLRSWPNPGAPFFMGDNARCGADVKFHDWVAIGSNALIGEGCELQRVVVWDGAVIPSGSKLIDTIVA
ncbi:MAG: sugar phosphate nucleotidyltransferase [Desulfobulbaceae bacterium]|nr:sugar phosphate nucleotidyltransferase [Desulfobulbaceae bacterium]HIJ79428.1 NTP transferase domain-containing protein [Deltaproteobacteria bacterium]